MLSFVLVETGLFLYTVECSAGASTFFGYVGHSCVDQKVKSSRPIVTPCYCRVFGPVNRVIRNGGELVVLDRPKTKGACTFLSGLFLMRQRWNQSNAR